MLTQLCPCPQGAVSATRPALQHIYPDQEKTLSTSASTVGGSLNSHATSSLAPVGLAGPAQCEWLPQTCAIYGPWSWRTEGDCKFQPPLHLFHTTSRCLSFSTQPSSFLQALEAQSDLFLKGWTLWPVSPSPSSLQESSF